MTLHTSSVALLIAAAAFYVPVLGLLIVTRRSWMDVLAVAAVVTVLCFTADVLVPPFGLVLFAGFQAAWIFIWLRSVVRSRRSKA
jgi:hypothetical protein